MGGGRGEEKEEKKRERKPLELLFFFCHLKRSQGAAPAQYFVMPRQRFADMGAR